MAQNSPLVYGWTPSKLDGTEYIASYDNEELPTAFSYEHVIPKVHDQGSESTCVAHALSATYDWFESLMNSTPKSYNFSIYNIYDRRENKGEGMSFKNALSILRHYGAVTTKEYRLKDFSYAQTIKEYAMIKNIISLKQSILMNGPCLIATMVKNPNSPEYWKGYQNFGGHAVSCVGWDQTGIIIRNSWGTDWGYNGYTHMNYEDFNQYVLEAWTFII